MEIKRLAKNSVLLAGTRFVEFLVGLIRIKLTALLLGAKGVGIVEQLTFFSQQSATFSLMSLAEGLVKQIAEGKSDKHEDVQRLLCSVLKCYLLLVSLVLSVIVLLLLFFSNFLTPYVFGDVQYINIYYAAILCLPILIFNSIPFSILKAFKSIKEIAKARMIIVAVNILFLVPSIYIWKLQGAVVYVIISYAVTLGVNFYFAKSCYLDRYDITLAGILRANISSHYFKELLVFSGFGVSVGLFSIVSEFIIRAIVVDSLGIEAIGLYSPVVLWASMLTGIVLPSFATYLYPRFCELKEQCQVNSLINDGVRLSTFVLIPFIFLAIPFKSYFISIFYSPEFSDAAMYLPIHFFGLIFYVWWFVFSQSLTPTGRIKHHGVMLVIFYIINIMVVTFSIDAFGLYAYAARFLVGPMLIFFVYLIYCKRSMGFVLRTNNLKIVLYTLTGGLFLIIIDLLSPYQELVYFLSFALIINVYFFLECDERALVTSGLVTLKEKIKGAFGG